MSASSADPIQGRSNERRVVKLILAEGIPGAGKTTFAEQLCTFAVSSGGTDCVRPRAGVKLSGRELTQLSMHEQCGGARGNW